MHNQLPVTRKRAGMTQLELSKLTAIPREVISRIESGKVDPKVSTIQKLAKALNCTVDDLLDKQDVNCSKG